MSEATVSFDKHLAEERAYYLGKTKTIPGSDKTIDQARKEYRDGVDKEDQRMADRRKKALGGKDPGTFTTAVTDGVTVEVQRNVPVEFSANVVAPPPTLFTPPPVTQPVVVSDADGDD